MGLTRGAVALKNAGSLADLVSRTAFPRSMLASWRSGRVRPSEESATRLQAALGIDVATWDEPAQQEAGPSPAALAADHAPGEAAGTLIPSPRELWQAARAHRIALIARGSAARDISAAINAERAALALVGGDTEVYNKMLKLTIITLKDHHPAAFEAWGAAMTAAGL